MSTVPRLAWFFVAALVAVMAILTLGERKLANPDEGRYSEISREMAQSGDFITPRLNGLKYFEKPPMQYWATAINFRVFGESEWTARLYVFLCALGCLVLVGLTATRLIDAEAGLLAVLALMSSWYFMAFSQVVTLDMGLTFWLTLAMVSLVLGGQSEAGWPSQKWILIGWAAMAGAVLSKGLIGLVFPAAAVFLYCLVHWDWRFLARLCWVKGIALFLLLTVPWFWAVSVQNPEFPRFFFIHEHFERFLSTVHRREAAWWTFFAIVFFGLLPWGLALFPAIRNAWQQQPLTQNKRAFYPLRLLLLFGAFVLLFFTKSSSKLPGYILPVFPALAIVLGVWLRQAPLRHIALWLAPSLLLLVAALAALFREVAKRKLAGDDFIDEYGAMATHLGWGITGLIAMILIAHFLLRRGNKPLALSLTSAGTALLVCLTFLGYEELSPRQSGYGVAEAIKPLLTPETRLYSVKTYDQSAPFYLKRTLTLVQYVDEFELGISQEPDKRIAWIGHFAPHWNAPGPAIAIIHPDTLDELAAWGIDFVVIHRDARRVAIRKP